jgi:hypothetical protein
MTREEFFSAVQANRALVFDGAPDMDRTLQGAWLSEAAERGFSVRVSNAIIVGPIVLDTVEVRASFELISCQLDLLSGRYATILKWFRLELCTFNGYCRLRGARFASGLWFRGSIFTDEFDLGYVTVAVDLDLDGINCGKQAYLVGLSVKKNFHTRKATFKDGFYMALATVLGVFDAKETRFYGDVILMDSHVGGLIFTKTRIEQTKDQGAAFDRLTVDSGANFSQASFDGPAAFGGLSVKGQLIFDEASFSSDCLIEGAIARDLFCRSITFESTTSLVGSHVFAADFTGSTFKGPARFNDLRVDVTLSLVSTTFSSVAVFDRMAIGQSIRVAGTLRSPAEFRGDVTSFAGATVGSQGIFEHVTFVGAAVFEGSRFGSDLFLDRCAFRAAASFIGMQVLGNISIVSVEFSQCEFHRLHCNGNFGFASCTITNKAELSYLSSDGNLVFSDCNFASELILKNSRIAAELSLRSTVLSEALSLEMVSCGILDCFPHLVDSAHDSIPDLSKIKINAIGLRYGQLYCVWRDFIAGVALSRLYVLDPYTQLEQQLRSVGAYHWADEVYVLGRRNFRNAFSQNSIRYWWDFALEMLSGYGLKPGRTIVALVILFALTTSLIAFIPFFAVQDATGACDFSQSSRPDLEIAMNLAARQYAVGGSDAVSGWSISDCALLGSWLRPYSVIGLLRLVALILIPFVVASFAGVLKYVGKRD